MKIHCKYDRLVDLGDLRQHPKNPNKHSEDQIKRLAQILEYQGWRYPIKVSKQSGYVTSGHGRMMAALKNKWREVPVNYQDYESEEQEYADLVSDNAIADWSELDLSKINFDVVQLGPDFDIDLLGIDGFVLDLSEKEVTGLDQAEVENLYTKKVARPVYEPKGEKPPIKDLYNRSITEKLLNKIDLSEIPNDIKEFLRLAAERHTVFDYERIAEFYSHAKPEVQELFEDSALVIIDFNKAIEDGFVVMTKNLAEAYKS